MIETKNVQKLMKDVRLIVKHHKELTKLRGETFNIFSILNMESKENGTHSAFLAELLNPKGSHYLGTVFLDLFLQVVKQNDKPFNINKARVITEKTIGARNDEKIEGGRIDIYIKDNDSNIISIENKIYAIDQNTQIGRYCNHNTEKNTVYYLTLFGGDPCDASKGKLIAGTDFYNISYTTHIVSWLKLCLKEATNQPILRETIKQYIILIKKLTNTLDTKEQQELSEAIFENFEEAKYIANNYYKLINETREKFRLAVFNQLKSKLDNSKYYVELGNPATSKYSQIWIYLKKYPKSKQFFGVESFSGEGNHNGNLFVGIINQEGGASEFKQQPDSKSISQWWPYTELFSKYNDEKLNLTNSKVLKLLHNTKSDSYKEILELICSGTIAFIQANEKVLFDFLENRHHENN